MRVAGMNIDLSKTWQWAKCSDVIDVRDGTHDTPKYVESGYPLVTSKNLKPEGIDFETVSYISKEDHIEISKRSKVDKGDILLAMIGTIGNPVLVDVDTEFSIKNTALFKFSESPIDARYFKLLLETPIIQRQLTFWTRGGTQKFVSLTVLRGLMIPFPPIAEQRRIAAILDKADGIRRDRKQAIQYTEELLRSAFLDMFGDPVTNPRGWESGTILDIVSDKKKGVRCGPFGTQLKVHEIVSEGIPLYGIESVKGGRFRSKAEKYITIQKAEELKSFDVQSGDVLVTRMGTIGHACVVSNTVGESRFSYHLFRVRPDSLKCLPGFLSATITRSGTFLSQLERLSHGAIMSGLKTADLKEVRFLLPPMALQKHYLKIVSKTEEALERQIEKMSVEENLFNSLLQRAFQGDL